LKIPLFKQVANSSLSSAYGDVIMDENEKVLTWTLDELPKEGKAILEGTISFPPEAVAIRPDVYLDFELMLWSASGLGIDSLTLLNEDYSHFKGVRTIVRGGKLRFRT